MVRSRKITKRFAVGAVVTAALLALSLANWAERGRFEVPEDGVVWSDSEGSVAAVRVVSKSPGALVGVRPGDKLRSIAGRPVADALDVPRILSAVGPWSRTEYGIERDGRVLHLSVVLDGADQREAIGTFLLALGWCYAAIGLWVWARCPQGRPTSRFLAFCLASLAVYSLSSTGRLEGLDRLVYWFDVWGLLLMPPLFLDFCSRFPDGSARSRGLTRAAYGAAVAVGAAHHAAAGGWVGGGIGDPVLIRFFDTAPLALLAIDLAAAGVMVRIQSRRAGNPVHLLQARWLLMGIVAAVGPFTALYAVPFAAGLAPGPNQAFSVFSLAALPLSIAVALFRYRLLDFEVVRRRVLASACAAALLGAAGYAALFLSGIPAAWLDRFAPLFWLGSLTLAAGLYRPLYKLLSRAFERRAFRDRYEDRRTLGEFARELAIETDTSRMAAAARTRLARALNADRIALLVPPDGGRGERQGFRLLDDDAGGREASRPPIDMSPIEELARGEGEPVTVAGPLPEKLSGELAALGCHHFVPCRVRERTAAWIGIGPARDGALLGSDDLALVEALSAPFAIALENARLYASLEAKAAQYRRLKDYNENIVESLSVGILVLDADGRVQSWNTQLELAFGISREAARGRRLGELLPQGLVEAFEQCTDESGAGTIYKFPLRVRDFPEEFLPPEPGGRAERIFNVAVAPLIDKGFRKVGQLLILDDVTERIELEKRVVEADKLSSVGLLAAGVAHEVNTPLAVISSYSQMLAGRFSTGSPEARMIGKVTEQTFRASEIVNSLLDFSRTSSSDMSRCDISRAIEDTLDLVDPQLRRAGVAVERNLLEPAHVLASKGKLQQVFLNLFLNARDAMPGGGSLRVSSQVVAGRSGDARVLVRVKDTGTGIPPEDQRRIFDPFFTTKGPRQGTGLGLAVTYGIVREHSGTISVESKPDMGTTFELRFPLADHPVHA